MRIHFDNVSCSLDGGTSFARRVLDGISIDIPSGQFVAVLGPSGAGKTTFAQIIGGLKCPDTGRATVGSYLISKKNKRLDLLRDKIGFVFQQPEHQFLRDTVEEDIALPLSMSYPASSPELKSRVKTMMERLGLPYETLRTRSPFRLSMGQMRRVALAGALLAEPKLLLLDEPAAGLDPVGRQTMLDSVQDLHESRKTTVIYITQRLEDALEYADRIIVLNRGSIVADMAPEDVPDLIRDLHDADITATPLLKFADRLQSTKPGFVSRHIVKEHAFLSHVTERLRRKD